MSLSGDAVTATYKFSFLQLPQSLIIRIERVGVLPSGTVFKLSDHVEFGETLDVRDLCFYRNREFYVHLIFFIV
uniref:Uncharacterized protein n=1 Tax=Heterorhabditis bacteriophora TaxID=37862 RepID=A0A1I7X8E2_HETBA